MLLFVVCNNEDRDLKYNSLVSPNYQASSHSSYHHFFFNSTTDQTGHYHHHHTEFYMQPEVDSDGASYDIGKNSKVGSSLKLTWWKREDKVFSKMNKKDLDQSRMKSITNNACIKLKLGDEKQQPSSPLETDSSNSSNNIPIRVCADCNTTKTPLWRSGPKGPKTLCNACGIRQRKARQAMAAAAEAAANGKTHTTYQTSSSSAMKIKVQHKEKKTKVNTNHVTPYKKRFKFGPSSSSTNAPKKIGNFEEFWINLSNNLAFHQIFPQDEKEAAILLMALSNGLVHG